MSSLPQERRRTEHRNPASRGLDRLPTKAILRLMNREDHKVAISVGREIPSIARAVDAIVSGIRKGGRLIYVGAGTSGRLAVLDAAECPPTFGVAPAVVQALIAGGRKALTGAVEGAEDSASDAVRDLRAKRLSRNDVVVGIAASGTTPYVLSALAFARKRGATTVAITSNRNAPIARDAQIVIADGSRTRNRYRFDAPEGRNLAKIGLEHALHRRHGALGARLRQLDDRRSPDK